MENTTITLRTYIEKDIPALTALTVALGYSTSPAEMGERLNNMHGNPHYKTIVACNGDEVLGYIGMIKNFFWEQNGCFVRIQALVVNSHARQKGIGAMLLQAAEQWAQEIDARLIVLNCGNKAERAAAHQFYPRMGFEAKSTGYIKTLDKKLK